MPSPSSENPETGTPTRTLREGVYSGCRALGVGRDVPRAAVLVGPGVPQDVPRGHRQVGI